jgi:hypothetical protein
MSFRFKNISTTKQKKIQKLAAAQHQRKTSKSYETAKYFGLWKQH